MRELVIDVASKLPEDATLEEIIDAIILRISIMKGLKDIEEEKVYTTEELLKDIQEWQLYGLNSQKET